MKTIKKLVPLLVGIVFITSCCDEEMQNQENAVAENAQFSQFSEKPRKFVLKAADQQYLSLGADSCFYATELDSSKAVVFENFDIGNGKVFLKASNGKMVCSDRNINNKLIANRNNAYEWETFELFFLSNNMVIIKSSDGKFWGCGDDKGIYSLGGGKVELFQMAYE
jgi:hypothetical protein